MYTMVLLDDEKIVLQGIQKVCEKEDCGFLVKGSVKSIGCTSGAETASDHYRCADAADGWTGICKTCKGNFAGE